MPIGLLSAARRLDEARRDAGAAVSQMQRWSGIALRSM
jgi:hypothetical protein